MIVRAAVKQGGEFTASPLVQQIEFLSTRRSASPKKCLQVPGWDDGPWFVGLKKYNNNIYRDEAVNTTPNTAD